jgi:hypothetical protein
LPLIFHALHVLHVNILPVILVGVVLVEAVLRVEGNLAAKAAELGPGLALPAHPLDLRAHHQVPATVKSDLRIV